MTQAFPRTGNYSSSKAEYDSTSQDGMTLRDWFAGQAMSQGMATLVASKHNLNGYQIGQLAETAYMAADAMLAEREKGGA